ncbi:MAG: CSLREA domain-containing protein, partial [Anaerolineae bacterium]
MRTLLNRAGLGAPTFLWIAVLVGCGLMWTLAWPQPAFAETITVNSTADVLDATDDRCTLREAIIAANSDTASGNLGAYPGECAAGNGADTVVFAAAGTYTLTLPGTGEDAAAGGDLDVTAALTLAGRGVDSTTIQAGSASPLPPGNCQDCIDRVLDAFAPLAISDLTLRYGTVELGPGGGLRVNDGSVVAASNIAVLDSVSQFGVGGGIGVLLGGVLTLDGSLVQGNFAAGGSGLFNAGQAALDQVTVSDNAAVDGLGSISSLGTLTVTRSSVISNTRCTPFRKVSPSSCLPSVSWAMAWANSAMVSASSWVALRM